MVNNGHCTYRYMVIKYCPYSVHIYKYTHQLPTQQAFHNIEIVVSCSNNAMQSNHLCLVH